MAKLDLGTLKEYAEQGGQTGKSIFFSLKDKWSAKVRFLANDLTDFDTYFLHVVETNQNDNKRYVNCLRQNLNEPLNVCPLCANETVGILKIFCPVLQLELYDENRKLIDNTPQVKIWERGKSYLSRFESIATRYNPLVSTVFEIERAGKKNDPKTEYHIYPCGTDNTTLESLPQKLNLDRVVWNKTAEEMSYFLLNGDFPESTSSEASKATNSRAQVISQPPSNNAYTPREEVF